MSTNLGTKQSWIKRIQVYLNEDHSPFQEEIITNNEIDNFCKTIGPISTKLAWCNVFLCAGNSIFYK